MIKRSLYWLLSLHLRYEIWRLCCDTRKELITRLKQSGKSRAEIKAEGDLLAASIRKWAEMIVYAENE